MLAGISCKYWYGAVSRISRELCACRACLVSTRQPASPPLRSHMPRSAFSLVMMHIYWLFCDGEKTSEQPQASAGAFRRACSVIRKLVGNPNCQSYMLA